MRRGSRAENWKPIEERILVEIISAHTNDSIHNLNAIAWQNILSHMNRTRVCDMDQIKKKWQKIQGSFKSVTRLINAGGNKFFKSVEGVDAVEVVII